MELTIDFGKYAYGSNRKVNDFTVTVELRYGDGAPVFAASGDIWNARHTDICCGGQCLDVMYRYLKGNPVFGEVYDLWKKYHLNDLHAGTRRQEQALRDESDRRNAAHRKNGEKKETPLYAAARFDEAVDYLKGIGLYEDALAEDEKVSADGIDPKRYEYGSAWVYRALSEDTIRRINGLRDLALKHGLRVTAGRR